MNKPEYPASVTSADGSFTLTQPPGGTLTHEQMTEIANEVARRMRSPEAALALDNAMLDLWRHGRTVIRPLPEEGKAP